jgi:hypothetical protein
VYRRSEFHRIQRTASQYSARARSSQIATYTGNTYFNFGGRQYHWKAHTVLIENDTRVCLALYHTVIYDGPKKALGSIVLTADGSLDGMDVQDLVVVTRLVDMARSDEAKLLVHIPKLHGLILLED